MMSLYLIADVGSTYTKLVAVDAKGRIVGRANAHTTVSTDVSIGFETALEEITRQVGRQEYIYLACSSAAGGLVMVACGLVPELTGQAARLAVLGAGAKLLQVLGYKINPRELELLAEKKPDMLLLAGGTDGGNQDILLNNARVISAGLRPLPVVLAGNKDCVYQAADIFIKADFPVQVTENVMPALGTLNIEPAREAIRSLFLAHIISAKGMNRLNQKLAAPILPTPAAVMAGGNLLAREYDQLLLVDIGGATTDVYSYGADQVGPGMVRRGLTPPWEMRTVEADLGMRYSLGSLVEQVGRDAALAGLAQGVNWEHELAQMLSQPDYLVPPRAQALETSLARQAVALAVARHAGTLERVYSPLGNVDVLRGKDLRSIKTVVGVGGVIANSPEPGTILTGASVSHPERLLPTAPKLLVDKHYILAAAGLLADRDPGAATNLLADSISSGKDE